MDDISRIVEKSSVEKAAKLLRHSYLNEVGRVKHSILSKEAKKIKLLLDDNVFNKDDVDNLFNEISYGKTNNQFPSDYTKQRNVKFEDREYSIIDYRESILILAILLECIDCKKESEIISQIGEFGYSFNSSYAIKEEEEELEGFNEGWCNFNEKNTWHKNSGTYSRVIKLDIKNAFRSIDINFLYNLLERNNVNNDQKTILKIFLDRIEPRGGIPLFLSQMLISRIIWTYLFEEIILEFIKSNSGLKIYLNLYVDDIYIYINNEDEKGIISSFSKHIEKYSLSLNDLKTEVMKIEDLSNLEYSHYIDEFEMNRSEMDYETKEVLEEIFKIEISYIKKRIQSPWINCSSIKEEDYSKLSGEFNRLIHSNQVPYILDRNIESIHNETNLNSLYNELVSNYVSFFREEEIFINESDLYFYLNLIDVKKLKRYETTLGHYKENIISPLYNSIKSSFRFIHNSGENIKWLYMQLRDTRMIGIDNSQYEIIENFRKNSIFNFEVSWRKSLAGFFASQTHFYSKDIAVLLTSNRAALSWVYNNYIDKSGDNDPDKNFGYFLKTKGETLSKFSKYRHNSPITHAPKVSSSKIIEEIYFGKPYDMERVWNFLEEEVNGI